MKVILIHSVLLPKPCAPGESNGKTLILTTTHENKP